MFDLFSPIRGSSHGSPERRDLFLTILWHFSAEPQTYSRLCFGYFRFSADARLSQHLDVARQEEGAIEKTYIRGGLVSGTPHEGRAVGHRDKEAVVRGGGC